MEQPKPEQDYIHTETVPVRLLHGVGQTVLNVWKRIDDAFDMSFYAQSHVQPGILDVMKEIIAEKRGKPGD